MEIRTSTLNGHGSLPLVVEPAHGDSPCAEQLATYITSHHDWLTQALHLHGGVLFRGFTIREVEAFQQVARAVIPELLPYVEGQSPRTKVLDNVYTSTEFPAQYTITPHNELSYAKSPPPRIIFHCHIAPGEGGETPIFDFRKVYAAMDPALRSRFERAGVKYVKNMHARDRGLGKSWMQHFETNDRAVVESYLCENDIEYEWANDGTLKTWSVRPASRQHPVTGEWHWFNQANLWHVSNVDERHRAQLLERCGDDNLPTHAFYGDGQPIADDELNRVRQVMWDHAVIFPWQQGDVLVLDNYLVAHGRMPYKGPRKILVAMG
jgi:alpha-ketoglutarate-dependent taurine dioxygenase